MTSNYVPVVRNLSPISYLRLNEAAGPTAVDSSGSRSAPGTYVGTPTSYGNTGPLAGDTTSLAVKLDGSTSYVEVPAIVADAIGVGVAPFSLAVWVNPGAAAPSGRIASLENTSDDGGFFLSLASGVPSFFRYNVSASDDTIAATPALTQSVFTFVVATYDGTNLNLFVNGVAAHAAVASSKVIPAYADAQFAWGANFNAGGGAANFLAAELSEAAVFNYALTLADVQALYHLGSGEFAVTAADPQDILDGAVPFSHIASTNVEGVTAAVTVLTTGAGTGSAAVLNFGNDTAGKVTVTEAGTPTAAAIVAVAFGTDYTVAPVVVISPASAKAVADGLYVTSVTTTGFNVSQTTGTTADSVVFDYIVFAAV